MEEISEESMTEYQEVCKSQMTTDETASAEDVKDISNRILFNQVVSSRMRKKMKL
jgi:hypothetical protein